MNLSLSCVSVCVCVCVCECVSIPSQPTSFSLPNDVFWIVQITKLEMTQCFFILLFLFICRAPSLPLPNILFANNPNTC